MLPNTVDALELIYTLFAFLGALGALGAVGYAARDWRVNRMHPDGDPQERRRNTIVAWQVLQNRVVSLCTQIGVVIIGLRAMSLPPNQAAAQDWTAYIVGVVLLGISLLASLNALSNLISNYQFDHVEGKGTSHE